MCPVTLQPMSDAANGATKAQARQDFSRWLNDVCDRLDAPRRGRPGWLRKRLASRGLKVSYETCRKWLGGLDIPDRANEGILLEALGVKLVPQATDAAYEALRRYWMDLPPEAQEHVLETARMAHAAFHAPAPVKQRKRGP